MARKSPLDVKDVIVDFWCFSLAIEAAAHLKKLTGNQKYWWFPAAKGVGRINNQQIQI